MSLLILLAVICRPGLYSPGRDIQTILSARIYHSLYRFEFKGCISCFACKTRDGKSYGKCAVKDDLTPVYAEINGADAIILGSPIYFGDVTGQLRSFMERLLFPHYTYTDQILFPRTICTGLIYTMNAPEEWAQAVGYEWIFNNNEAYMKKIFGHAESIMSYDTY